MAIKPVTSLIKKPPLPVVAAFAPLPTKQTLEGSQISQLKLLMYGPPGIGKSTFLSKATQGTRQPLFLHTDPGLRFIKAFKQPIMTWKGFKHYNKTLTQDGGKAASKLYSIVVLDTVDLLYRMCRQDVCKRMGWDHVSEGEYGKGSDMVRDEFEQELIKLAKLDEARIGLAFISHSKDVEIRGRAVRTSKIIPSMPKQAHDIIAPLCDVIGYAGHSLEKADRTPEGEMGRIAIFEPEETVEAKDRTGLLPSRCKLDFDVVREYLEGTKKAEKEYEPAEATDEEVQE